MSSVSGFPVAFGVESIEYCDKGVDAEVPEENASDETVDADNMVNRIYGTEKGREG